MGKKKMFEDIPKEIINFRCPVPLIYAMKKISEKTRLNKTQIILLSLMENIGKFEEDIFYEGIDLKKYAYLYKIEILRNITKKERNEFMSSLLFMNRVKSDIYKILMLSPKQIRKDRKKILTKVIEYLDIRKKEATYHENKIELLKELEDFKKDAEQNLENMKSMIEVDIEKQIRKK